MFFLYEVYYNLTDWFMFVNYQLPWVVTSKSILLAIISFTPSAGRGRNAGAAGDIEHALPWP